MSKQALGAVVNLFKKVMSEATSALAFFFFALSGFQAVTLCFVAILACYISFPISCSMS